MNLKYSFSEIVKNARRTKRCRCLLYITFISSLSVCNTSVRKSEVVWTHCFLCCKASGGDGHACGKLEQVVKAAAHSRRSWCRWRSKSARDRRRDEVLSHLKQPQQNAHTHDTQSHTITIYNLLQTYKEKSDGKAMPKEATKMKHFSDSDATFRLQQAHVISQSPQERESVKKRKRNVNLKEPFL